MLESNMMRDEISDAVSRTRKFGEPRRLARPPRSSFRRVSLIVCRRCRLARATLSPPRLVQGERRAGQPFPTERCQAWRVSPPLASA
jgi:hypothetical protein